MADELKQIEARLSALETGQKLNLKELEILTAGHEANAQALQGISSMSTNMALLSQAFENFKNRADIHYAKDSTVSESRRRIIALEESQKRVIQYIFGAMGTIVVGIVLFLLKNNISSG